MRSFRYSFENNEAHVDLIAEDGTTVLLTANFPTEDSTLNHADTTFAYHCEQEGVEPLTKEELDTYYTWIKTQVS